MLFRRYRFFIITFIAVIMLFAGVKYDRAYAASPTINKKTASIAIGQTVNLSVSGASGITWSSSNNRVASVSNKGTVTGKAAGTSKITAMAGRKKLTCKVTVSKQSLKLDNNTAGMTAAEARVYKTMLAQRSVLKQGMTWTNNNSYKWKGGRFALGYGCSAFAFKLSDAAFGDTKAESHTDFNNIKVGDIVRVNSNHSVVALKIVGDYLVVAEGNICSRINWGRRIPLSDIRKDGVYVMTRY